MKNFDYIKILYSETPQSQKDYQSDTGALDCRIMLVSKKRQAIGFEVLTKNIGGIFGLGGNISYLNRNIFRRAESLQFTLKYTQELRIDTLGAHFQNYEAGGTIALEFPRFLFPIKPQNIPKQLYPKTIIGLGVNYLSQKQYHYARFLTSTSFTYEWSERKIQPKKQSFLRLTHSLTVWDFSLVKLYKDAYFDSITRNFFANSKRVAEKYKDNFLLGSSYQITLQKSSLYVFRGSFRAYGNLLYGIMRAAGKRSDKYKVDSTQYAIWGIPFATGITTDIDFVYNILQKRKDALVYHIAVGIGIPTANSHVLPFEYSYYLGGSNSMRAWTVRTLGPGGYTDTLVLDRVGDVKFEMNLEYRVPVYKRFHFGIFMDMGNIWLLRKTESYPDGEFTLNRFLKEIAISAGVGLRLDLSFFVIRIDYALKIRNPAKTGIQRWQDFQWENYKSYTADRGIVFGIGYPF
jgi:outer membrane protein assembly factor BamA